ncbi:MAG TPA: ATP-binding cassette domain-containing protein, partial [Candidatus Latescibacteria bacterium]|nr:ATP-binding cassette domain-containing protein [Candidatus Latescibacterota bacterium]
MSLFKGAGVGKYFGAQDVFKNLDFSIEMADRIGLVGPNGEGKTTLLEILAGVQEATAGQLQNRRDLRIGYLPQDPPVFAGMTLWQGMLEAFADLRRLEAELQELAQHLHDAEVLPRYSALQTEFERREGYTYETRIRTVLMGLGFGEDDFQLDMAHLSGGQRTRSLLARLLLEDPEILLLDEPTNHLDLVAVEWLESFLQTFKGGLIVVSHDRYFLDTVSNRTWEMAFGVLETYRGNYSAYARQRGERYQRRLKEWQEQQEYIAKTEDFIRRHIAGQRTKEAQGRRTRLQRFMRDEAIAKPEHHEDIRVRLSPPKRSGDIVLGFSDVEIGYEPERPILRMPDMELRRGMRVAVVGPNGAGKTTLIRSILGELATLAGKIKAGTAVEMGYLSQDHDYLDKDADLVDTVRRIRPDMSIEETRTLLGSFLFKGDEVFKPIGDLSGGQRSRLALVRLAVQEVNVLVLDEPTNHLDIASQEVLENVLANFDGTFLLVSHDRYLVQALATHVWAVEEGAMQVMEGGWEVYLQWRETRRGAQEIIKASRQDEREVQREARRERKQLEKMASRQREVEEEIAQLEEQMALLSERISAVGEKQNMEQVHALGKEYGELGVGLAGLWREWE